MTARTEPTTGQARDDDPWAGYPPGQPIGEPYHPFDVELVKLECGCGHIITGLPTEDLPCHACLHDEDDPHTCPLTNREAAVEILTARPPCRDTAERAVRVLSEAID